MDKIFSSPKYTFVSVNFLFVITGIIVLSVGVSVQSAYNEYDEFLTKVFFSLPKFCIAAGVIIFLIAAAGFYGAFLENTTVNMVFALFMVIIFIFQLSACIAGYVLRGNTMQIVQEQLNATMYQYGVDKSLEISTLWDEVQEDFQCCGVNNATDWLSPLGTEQNQGLPVTCCRRVPGTVFTVTCTVPGAHDIACADVFADYVKSLAASIGIAGIFLILLQGMVVAGSVWVVKLSGQ